MSNEEDHVSPYDAQSVLVPMKVTTFNDVVFLWYLEIEDDRDHTLEFVWPSGN